MCRNRWPLHFARFFFHQPGRKIVHCEPDHLPRCSRYHPLNFHSEVELRCRFININPLPLIQLRRNKSHAEIPAEQLRPTPTATSRRHVIFRIKTLWTYNYPLFTFDSGPGLCHTGGLSRTFPERVISIRCDIARPLLVRPTFPRATSFLGVMNGYYRYGRVGP